MSGGVVRFSHEAMRALVDSLLRSASRPVGFIDVGSGGTLKEPWSLLPDERIRKFDFDPETHADSGVPVCISNTNGSGSFHIAIDPRASSIHAPDTDFMVRFGAPGLAAERVIPVALRTVDELFAPMAAQIDTMDINVEGHDFQVLQGAGEFLDKSFLKLLKVEFELCSVWHGQGYLADIDTLLRGRGFELVRLEIDELVPVIASGLPVGAEPVWGKAYFVPGKAAWEARRQRADAKTFTDDVRIAIALYSLFAMPARALETAALAGDVSPWPVKRLRTELETVYRDTRLSRRLFRSLPAPMRAVVARLLGRG